MKASTRNKAAGNTNIAKGKAKAVAGRVVRKPGLQARGVAQQIAGRIQKKVGARQKAKGR